jgi:lysophospholipase-2
MQAHGDCDPVVPYRWGQLTSTALKTFCKSHEFKTYKGLSHSSSPAELLDIKTFMQTLIPAEK